MISIEAVMSTALLTVRDTDTLAAADERMEVAGIRHLPVSDAHNHVVGIISTRDLAAHGRKSKTKRVGQVMSRDVKTVRPDDPADKAVALMIENKIGSLPVVDEQETLIGIVTETDFLRVAHQALTANRRTNGKLAASAERR
jgi:CBS domain-containing protein